MQNTRNMNHTHFQCSGGDSSPSIILIGLGPYAKRHYISFFRKNDNFPQFIVDLESKKDDIQKFLSTLELEIPCFYISDTCKDCGVLPENIREKFLMLLEQYHVTHAIISSEPKSHLAYLDFLIENGINILVEKPLTAPSNGSFSLQAAEKVESDYQYLLNKLEMRPFQDVRVDIQCHRRYHPVYNFVQNQIEMFVREFDIPPTYCDIYHCDGMWNMPNEFFSRENHPYKYGYGKLFHSGYHFIDLLTILLKSGFKHCSKVPNFAEMYGTNFSPYDAFSVFNQNDYIRFFNKAYEETNPSDFEGLGELDFFSILQLYNGNKKITTCNINLLQTGFSRRAWSELPEDTYKQNGRIRHERVNIQFGPLFNIQVHSYLSTESKFKTSQDPFSAGNTHHFDVMIFRNSSLIGGKPYELFRYDDFATDEQGSFNEVSRARCLKNFLSNSPSSTDLRDHKLGIQLLSKALKTLCRTNAGEVPIEKFDVDIISEHSICLNH